jgi:hypothetical protein
VVRDSRVTSWLWFAVWVPVGALVGVGLISLGPLALLPAVLITVAITTSTAARRSACGLISGTGLVSLYVAYVQREGPGTTCWRTATGGGCEDHLDPRPWLVAGVALVVLGVVAQLLIDRRRARRAPAIGVRTP